MSADLCGCGCCDAPAPAVPRPHQNVPGLPQGEYRIGTYATFREGLVERLARQLALRDLTTRDDADYAMAVLGSWAYIADILTFYSERSINESFLRTARLRDSIARLAAMVGYDLSPGLSATAQLAFTFDAGTHFTLEAGARVQSVPPAGDNAPPVKFETLDDLVGIGGLSRVAIVGPPVVRAFGGVGSTMAFVRPGTALPPEVNSGAPLLAWTPGANGHADRLQVAEVEPGSGPAGALHWAPPLTHAFAKLNGVVSELRILGHDAPTSFMATSIPEVTAGGPAPLPRVVAFRSGPGKTVQLDGDAAAVSYDFSLPASSTLTLDREYPNLVPGSQIVLAVPAPGGGSLTVGSCTVNAATSVAGRFGPQSATVTSLTLDVNTPGISDRRTVQLFHVGPALPLWDKAPADTIDQGRFYASLDAADHPAVGRQVVLTDAAGHAEVGHIHSIAAGTDDLAGYQEITVVPRPEHDLDARTAVLLGNVVRSSHGEAVVDELLGTGDATVAFQRFKLAKPPLTRVPRAGAPHGGQSTLVVRVDGLEWLERERLYGAGAGDRVFVVEVDDDGAHHITFGDGATGARLATGATVRASYRKGIGVAGNVGAGLLTSPLTRPKGLASVTSPLAAAGGADPETASEARENAPNTVRTFGRIVSLQDAEDQARSNALVAKARATWMRLGIDLGVKLVVAGPGGALLPAAQLSDLRADLDARRDPNRPMSIVHHQPVGLELSIKVIARDPAYAAADVAAAVTAAVREHFAFDQRTFGQPVRLSEVFVAAQGAAGVVGVDVDRCTLVSDALAAHDLGIEPLYDRIKLRPEELATLEAPGSLVVTAA